MPYPTISQAVERPIENPDALVDTAETADTPPSAPLFRGRLHIEGEDFEAE